MEQKTYLVGFFRDGQANRTFIRLDFGELTQEKIEEIEEKIGGTIISVSKLH